MKVLETPLAGALVLEPRVFEDARGFFLESYNQEVFAGIGIRESFVQDNHSYSLRSVLRGLHYQVQKPQGKLVRVVSGEVLDVFLDLRRSSPTFGRWPGFPWVSRMDSMCCLRARTYSTNPRSSTFHSWSGPCSGMIRI